MRTQSSAGCLSHKGDGRVLLVIATFPAFAAQQPIGGRGLETGLGGLTHTGAQIEDQQLSHGKLAAGFLVFANGGPVGARTDRQLRYICRIRGNGKIRGETLKFSVHVPAVFLGFWELGPPWTPARGGDPFERLNLNYRSARLPGRPSANHQKIRFCIEINRRRGL